MVVAEYVPSPVVKQPVSVITQDQMIIVPLSARTEGQLKQKAQDMLAFLRNSKQPIDLVQLAYTLQTGREAMGERLGLMVASLEQLTEKLQAYVDGNEDVQHLYKGQVKRHKEGLSIINRDDDLKQTIVDTWISQQKLSNLVDLWAKGMELDWNRLYGNTKPQRINLPTYPFAKERYWYTETAPQQHHKTEAKLSVLHPCCIKMFRTLTNSATVLFLAK
ncbi:MAG: hypothetical protein HC896_06335 [Bacteroidales bacterium]|nr:hypothetical protein [Bacteroidales bacterium]